MSLTATMLPRRSCSSSSSTGWTSSTHPRRRSSAQRIVSTSTWAARSPPPLPLELEARTLLVCTCYRLILLPSLSPPSSRQTHEGFNGVLSMIGSLIADLAKETQEAKVDEEHAPTEYEAFMSESAASRADKVKELEELQNPRLLCPEV